MRYAMIQASWVMPIADVAPGTVSVMVADTIRGEIDDIRDVRVHTQPMPPEYNRMMTDSDEAKEQIENDADQSFGFIDRLAGPLRVRHPWDDGMSIFPTDHPLYDLEQHYRAKSNKEAGEILRLTGEKMKELPRGSEDD